MKPATKLLSAACSLLLGASLQATAHEMPADFSKSPPAGAYKAVSSLVKLPDFLPGLGQPRCVRGGDSFAVRTSSIDFVLRCSICTWSGKAFSASPAL